MADTPENMIEKVMMDHFSPRTLMSFGRFATRLGQAFSVSQNDVLTALHGAERKATTGVSFYDSERRVSSLDANGLPVPPKNLRWGDIDEESGAIFHAPGSLEVPPGPDAGYLKAGAETAHALRTLMAEHGMPIEGMGNVLDWGGSSGRVLRHFFKEAQNAEYWGTDVGAPYIHWAQEHLTPPFNFVTTTALPHLPFEDNKFGFLYSISVLTHIDHLRDAWLMELRRVLRPGGCALLTIMDEHSVEIFRSYPQLPAWMPKGLDLDEIIKHDETIIRGQDWSWTFTIFKSEHVRREWGRFFEVVDIRPGFEHNQTGVLLRKR